MKIINTINYNPGGENETKTSGNSIENPELLQSKNALDADAKEEEKHHKTVMEKIREALHDWSNKDEQDQEFDDTRV